MSNSRFIQLVTGIHKIHHIHHSYGWKFALLPYGVFRDFRWLTRNFDGPFVIKRIAHRDYHNCTKTGTY